MYVMKTYGGVEAYIRSLLTLSLGGMRDRFRAPTALSPAKEPQGDMFLRAGLQAEQKRFNFCPCRE